MSYNCVELSMMGDNNTAFLILLFAIICGIIITESLRGQVFGLRPLSANTRAVILTAVYNKYENSEKGAFLCVIPFIL